MSESITPCALCASAAHLKKASMSGYKKGLEFDVYHCAHCDTNFVQPMCEAGTIYETIYRLGDQVPGYSRYWQFAKRVSSEPRPLEYLAETSEIYWGVIQELSRQRRSGRPPLRILEIGSGLGYLTYALRHAGFDALGLDLSQTAVSTAAARFGDYYVCQSIEEHLKTHAGHYDVTILSEVIEHIREPVAFIKTLLSIAAKGGIIILTTPNKRVYSEMIPWGTELPPVHYWWFSETSLRHICERIGCEVEFVDFSQYSRRHECTFIKDECVRVPVLNETGALNIPADGARISLFRRLGRSTLERLNALKTARRVRNALLGAKRLTSESYSICAVIRQPR
jgi:SAM-dependent methyltransferase